VKWTKAIGIWLSFPVLFPIFLSKFLGDNEKISWKIWCIQIVYAGFCIYGFLDWAYGWTPDPIAPPVTYVEPNEFGCDSGFYASVNAC
jgi:hypothetical protein